MSPEDLRELMSLAAAIVVVGFGLVLVAFTGVAFARPAIAERFLMRFASSARTHYVEQVFRLLIGAALVVHSPAMWQPSIFWLVGLAIVVSSAALLCVPWQWHHRFAMRVRPVVLRHLRLYALGAFAFGALLLYGVFAGGGAAYVFAHQRTPVQRLTSNLVLIEGAQFLHGSHAV